MHPDDQVSSPQLHNQFTAIRAKDILPEELVALVERVLPLQLKARAEARVTLPEPDDCASAEAMFAGSPLLLRQHFPCDFEQALGLMPLLLDQLEVSGGEAAKAAQTLRQALDSGELDAKKALLALQTGDDELFALWRQRLPGSPRALDFLVTSALTPSLSAAAQLLAQRLPENLPHDRGHCPLCGSLPLVTLLREKEGLRFGVCSFCGFEHRVRRIACPFCDEADQNKLKLFRVAEYPDARVDVCETCTMYVKTLDHRELEKRPLAALDDMATLALDILAQQQGYKRPTLSAWGF